MEISLDIRKVEAGKSLKASIDLTLIMPEGEITISSLKVIHQDGKEPWVAFPTNSYKDQSGEYKNFKIIEVSRGLRDRIVKMVLERYKTLN